MDITGVILMTGIELVVGFLVAALIFSLRRGVSFRARTQRAAAARCGKRGSPLA